LELDLKVIAPDTHDRHRLDASHGDELGFFGEIHFEFSSGNQRVARRSDNSKPSPAAFGGRSVSTDPIRYDSDRDWYQWGVRERSVEHDAIHDIYEAYALGFHIRQNVLA
jgi:hypothetical protein